MAEGRLLLVINPGSTSTKIALFRESEEVDRETLLHSAEDLAPFPSIASQAELRRAAVNAFLAGRGISVTALTAVVGRGGLLHALSSGGTYTINSDMLADLRAGRYGEHASALGSIIAAEIAETAGIPALTVDPVVVDEMIPESRLSGMPGNPRLSRFHCLNQRAAARTVAERLGMEYANGNFIVAHMGGGISVGAHRRGRVIDVNNALDGDGPFSPERSGDVPIGPLVSLALRAAGDEAAITDLRRRMVGRGGLVAYLGSSSLKEARERAKSGDGEAATVLGALELQVAQEISQHAATLHCDVDAIVLTGGMAHDHELVAGISARVSGIAAVHTVSGEMEMEALAAGALRVLDGVETARIYAREPESGDAPESGTPAGRERVGAPHPFLRARSPRQRVAVAGGDAEEVLRTIALTRDMADFVLCADEARIESLVSDLGAARDDFQIHHVPFTADRSAYSRACAEAAADLAGAGEVQVLMKGLVQTADYMKAALDRKRGLIGEGGLLTHIGRMEISGRNAPVYICDGAIIPAPDVPTRLAMLQLAVDALHRLGLERPRVALISAVEKVSPKVQSTVDAQEIMEACADWADAVVEGPMALDVAVNPVAAAHKGVAGEVAGNANLLLFPGIDAGNVAYKAVTSFTRARTAAAVLGARVPMVLTSRSDNEDAKALSLGMALELAENA